jgi:hypothetical protein
MNLTPNATLNDTTTALETAIDPQNITTETNESASKTKICYFFGTIRQCPLSCGNCLCLCRCAHMPLVVLPLPPAFGLAP